MPNGSYSLIVFLYYYRRSFRGDQLSRTDSGPATVGPEIPTGFGRKGRGPATSLAVAGGLSHVVHQRTDVHLLGHRGRVLGSPVRGPYGWYDWSISWRSCPARPCPTKTTNPVLRRSTAANNVYCHCYLLLELLLNTHTSHIAVIVSLFIAFDPLLFVSLFLHQSLQTVSVCRVVYRRLS